MPVATELRGVVAEFVAAVNTFDLDRIVATFTPDAYVNDVSREMWGTNAIRAFMAKEMVGDHVTMEVREVLDHYGDIIVRARIDGTYDKTNLPDELVLTSYFGICDDKITSLTIIAISPVPIERSCLHGPLRLGRSFINVNATTALPATAESGADRHKPQREWECAK
jgi:hypothetical protein